MPIRAWFRRQTHPVDDVILRWHRAHARALYLALVRAYPSYPSASDADDSVLHAYLQLHRHLSAGAHVDDPKAWLWTVAQALMQERAAAYEAARDRWRVFACDMGLRLETNSSPYAPAAIRSAWSRLSLDERRLARDWVGTLRLREVARRQSLTEQQAANAVAHVFTRLMTLCRNGEPRADRSRNGD